MQVPFSLDVVFESGSFIDREEELSGTVYDKLLAEKINDFDKRFEDTFELAKTG